MTAFRSTIYQLVKINTLHKLVHFFAFDSAQDRVSLITVDKVLTNATEIAIKKYLLIITLTDGTTIRGSLVKVIPPGILYIEEKHLFGNLERQIPIEKMGSILLIHG